MAASMIACSSNEVKEVEMAGATEVSPIKLIDYSGVKSAIRNNKTIIDTNEYDEFNGWDVDGDKVAGHIGGAINIPKSSLDGERTDIALERNDIQEGSNIIVYGRGSMKMGSYLSSKGHSVSIFDNGRKVWLENGGRLEELENKDIVVPNTWVKDILEGKDVEGYDGRPVKVFNVGWDKTLKTHKKGHVPGSYWVHTGWIEEGPLWNRVSDEKLKKEMEKLGITKDTLVVVYGDDQTPAARFGIMARYMGVEDVRLMNGGLRGWKADELPLAYDEEKPVPVEEFGADEPLNKEIIIDHEKAIDYLKDESSDLVAIRSWKEYTGKTSGYDYIKPRGRIRGAKWGMGGLNPWNLDDYRGIDQAHMRPYNELEKMWKDLKIDRNNKIAFYCGTGWRASEVWFYAQAMGIDTSAMYDGGWKEWSEHPDTKKDFLRGEPVELNTEKY